ncbi:MAG: cell division topological specificity factor MinE [Clostridiales bacterium]|jgi:cell division topological specificity factor|nr:cell division topological specificity factor MinE [Clostridiales bacterium]
MDFFGLFGKKQKSGSVAKSRLQLVLIQDRLDTTPEMLEMLKSDILKVLTNYMELDEDDLDIDMDSGADGPALVANIPIKSWKKR